MYFLSTLKAEAADEAVLEDLTVGMEHVIQTKNVVALMIVVNRMHHAMRNRLIHIVAMPHVTLVKNVDVLSIVVQKKNSLHVIIVVTANVTQMKTTVTVNMTVVVIPKYAQETQMLLSKIVVQALQVSMEYVYLLHEEYQELLKTRTVSQKLSLRSPATIYL